MKPITNAIPDITDTSCAVMVDNTHQRISCRADKDYPRAASPKGGGLLTSGRSGLLPLAGGRCRDARLGKAKHEFGNTGDESDDGVVNRTDEEIRQYNVQSCADDDDGLSGCE